MGRQREVWNARDKVLDTALRVCLRSECVQRTEQIGVAGKRFERCPIKRDNDGAGSGQTAAHIGVPSDLSATGRPFPVAWGGRIA